MGAMIAKEERRVPDWIELGVLPIPKPKIDGRGKAGVEKVRTPDGVMNIEDAANRFKTDRRQIRYRCESGFAHWREWSLLSQA